jgi:hypothetical protein
MRPSRPLFPPPPTTQPRPRNKGRQVRSWLTLNGRVQLNRRRLYSPADGSVAPLDALLDQAASALSVGVRELACRLNQHAASFDKAAENLARAAQLALSGEALRQVVEAEGRAVLQAEASGALPIGWTAADCPTAAGPTRVYLGLDGVKVPLITDTEKRQRRPRIRAKRRRAGKKLRPLPKGRAGADQPYKEFKLVVYYDEGQVHRHVSGTRGDHQAAGRRMRRDGGRIDLTAADDKVAVVDGADWIRNQIRRQNLPLDAVGLDFYHLAENVHKARRAVFGEEGAEGQEWAGQLLHTVKHEGYEAFWQRLVEWRAKLRSPKKRLAADALLNYVAERREMIKYPELVAAGRQIGSGPTEAMCKVTTARLKGSGMRWDGANAEAVMALSCLEQSGQWKAYWANQLRPTG